MTPTRFLRGACDSEQGKPRHRPILPIDFGWWRLP